MAVPARRPVPGAACANSAWSSSQSPAKPTVSGRAEMEARAASMAVPDRGAGEHAAKPGEHAAAGRGLDGRGGAQQECGRERGGEDEQECRGRCEGGAGQEVGGAGEQGRAEGGGGEGERGRACCRCGVAQVGGGGGAAGHQEGGGDGSGEDGGAPPAGGDAAGQVEQQAGEQAQGEDGAGEGRQRGGEQGCGEQRGREQEAVRHGPSGSAALAMRMAPKAGSARTAEASTARPATSAAKAAAARQVGSHGQEGGQGGGERERVGGEQGDGDERRGGGPGPVARREQEGHGQDDGGQAVDGECGRGRRREAVPGRAGWQRARRRPRPGRERRGPTGRERAGPLQPGEGQEGHGDEQQDAERDLVRLQIGAASGLQDPERLLAPRWRVRGVERRVVLGGEAKVARAAFWRTCAKSAALGMLMMPGGWSRRWRPGPG